MSTLRDPRLEIFAREYARLKAAGMPASQAAADAAVEARYKGYQNPSKTFAANARKKAQREDVKARVAELLAPALERAEIEIGATVDWATRKLCKIANYDLGQDMVKVPDQISAIKLLAELKGWLAVAKLALTNPQGDGPATLKFERIERILVDPAHTDSARVSTAA